MKPTIFSVLFFLIGFAILAQDADVATQKLFSDKKHSTITYSMNHPLHSWTGVSNDINSVVVWNPETKAISQVAVAVKVASFDSENANRDSHMLEVTEALLYPNISFTSDDIQVFGDSLLVSGTMTWHGISKTSSFKAAKQLDGKTLKVSGSLIVLMTDFNIEPPSLMAMETDDEIGLTFEVQYH